MDNQIQPNIPPLQPQTQILVPPSTNWLKILLLAILGLIVVAGSVFVGIQIGKNQTPNQQPIVVQPTIIPTQTVGNPTTAPVIPSPATNPVTKWKIYTNETYGFSIDYPDLIIIDEKNQNGTLSVFFRLKKLDNAELVCNGTHLILNVNTEGMCGSLAFKGTTSKINKSIYFLDKVSTTRYDDYFQDKHVETRLDAVTQGKNNFQIDYIITPEDYSQLNENHQLFNQMLSTFKFIK